MPISNIDNPWYYLSAEPPAANETEIARFKIARDNELGYPYPTITEILRIMLWGLEEILGDDSSRMILGTGNSYLKLDQIQDTTWVGLVILPEHRTATLAFISSRKSEFPSDCIQLQP